MSRFLSLNCLFIQFKQVLLEILFCSGQGPGQGHGQQQGWIFEDKVRD